MPANIACMEAIHVIKCVDLSARALQMHLSGYARRAHHATGKTDGMENKYLTKETRIRSLVGQGKKKCISDAFTSPLFTSNGVYIGVSLI